MNTTMNMKHEQITVTQSRVSVSPRKRKRAITRADWLVPAGLILLTAIPALGGVLGLVGFATGAALTPDDTQFRTLPLPIVLHIVSALPFCPALRLPVRRGLAPKLSRLPPSRRTAGSPVWLDCR